MTAHEIFSLLGETWFLEEPAFFSLYCQQRLVENPHIACAVRVGQGRLEYNALLVAHQGYEATEQQTRIELIRLFLGHPYQRRPEGCPAAACATGSDITIADGYCLLHQERLPLHDPTFYHLPLGQYYEWYAKQLAQQQSDDRDSSSTSSSATPPPTPADEPSAADKAALWQEDSLERQRIVDLIDRTHDWGSLPAEMVTRIRAAAHAPSLDTRRLWQGFLGAILGSQRLATRLRPNRRTGWLEMGYRRQPACRLLVSVDTSGSLTDESLAAFFAHVNRMARNGVSELYLCFFDAVLYEVQRVRKASLSYRVTGRGGTSFQPLFDYLASPTAHYDGVVIFTDGQAPAPVNSSTHPLPPILWVCASRADYLAAHQWMEQTGRVTFL